LKFKNPEAFRFGVFCLGFIDETCQRTKFLSAFTATELSTDRNFVRCQVWFLEEIFITFFGSAAVGVDELFIENSWRKALPCI